MEGGNVSSPSRDRGTSELHDEMRGGIRESDALIVLPVHSCLASSLMKAHSGPGSETAVAMAPRHGTSTCLLELIEICLLQLRTPRWMGFDALRVASTGHALVTVSRNCLPSRRRVGLWEAGLCWDRAMYLRMASRNHWSAGARLLRTQRPLVLDASGSSTS